MSWLDKIILWLYDWWVGPRDDNDHEPRGPPNGPIETDASAVAKRAPLFKWLRNSSSHTLRADKRA